MNDTDLLDLNHLVGVAIHGHVEGGHGDEAALLLPSLSLSPNFLLTTLSLTSHRNTSQAGTSQKCEKTRQDAKRSLGHRVRGGRETYVRVVLGGRWPNLGRRPGR